LEDHPDYSSPDRRLNKGGVKDEVDLREHFNQVLQKVEGKERKHRSQCQDLSPPSIVVKLLHYYNICYHYARSVHNMANDPEADVLATDELLARCDDEVEVRHKDTESMPESVQDPSEE